MIGWGCTDGGSSWHSLQFLCNVLPATTAFFWQSLTSHHYSHHNHHMGIEWLGLNTQIQTSHGEQSLAFVVPHRIRQFELRAMISSSANERCCETNPVRHPQTRSNFRLCRRGLCRGTRDGFCEELGFPDTWARHSEQYLRDPSGSWRNQKRKSYIYIYKSNIYIYIHISTTLS